MMLSSSRSSLPRDLLWEAGAAAANRLHLVTKAHWQHPAPIVWPPPETHRTMRRIAQRELPGGRYRRHLLWRYSLTWTKPVS